MHSFIDSVVKEVISSQKKISKCTFILPSKRAGLFLKQSLKTNLNAPLVLPEIYSIEEFIEELSKLKIIDNIESLFEFYNIYLNHTRTNANLEAKTIKELLFKKYPNSIYTQMLINPDFKLELGNKIAKEELILTLK